SIDYGAELLFQYIGEPHSVIQRATRSKAATKTYELFLESLSEEDNFKKNSDICSHIQFSRFRQNLSENERLKDTSEKLHHTEFALTSYLARDLEGVLGAEHETHRLQISKSTRLATEHWHLKGNEKKGYFHPVESRSMTCLQCQRRAPHERKSDQRSNPDSCCYAVLTR
ncbi:10614_t:CDS:2, partial [Paraglomus occultum]